MNARMLPHLSQPVHRSAAGRPGAGARGVQCRGDGEGVSASIIGFMGLPFADDAAVAPSFIFPPLPFAEDGAE